MYEQQVIYALKAKIFVNSPSLIVDGSGYHKYEKVSDIDQLAKYLLMSGRLFQHNKWK